MRQDGQRRDSRGGYVLVVLLASSAIVLITLAMSLPRMAIQSQRIKEERLIYRGEQYQRAIKLYFREHKKYPEDLDDLEDTNGVRYLRKRYKDPLTGEDQWRMIHMGADGRFKDSLIYDQAQEGEEGGFGSQLGSSSGFGSSGFGANTSSYRPPSQMPMPGQFQGGARARAVRESAAPDQTENVRYNQGFEFPVGGEPGAPGQQPALGPDGQPLPQQPNYANVRPSQVPMTENQPPPPNPNAPYGRQGMPQPGQPGYDPRQQAGIGGGMQPTAPFGSQPAYGAGAVPGQFPAGQGQMPAGGTPAAFGHQGVGGGATNIIQRLLTTPRPGGLAGLQGSQQAQAGMAGGGAAAFQEGIAGVASMVEDFGVKTYDGREMYSEWEFVYDYRKDMGAGAGVMPGMGGGGLAAGQPGMGPGRGLSMNPGMVGGVSPAGQQGRAATGAGGYPSGFGATGGRQPGTATQPGSGYGAQPGGTGPYGQQPRGTSPYQPTGGPSPYGATPGAPSPYSTPQGGTRPAQPGQPSGVPSPYQPPAQNGNQRRR